MSAQQTRLAHRAAATVKAIVPVDVRQWRQAQRLTATASSC
jgi:hypothetical protein